MERRREGDEMVETMGGRVHETCSQPCPSGIEGSMVCIVAKRKRKRGGETNMIFYPQPPKVLTLLLHLLSTQRRHACSLLTHFPRVINVGVDVSLQEQTSAAYQGVAVLTCKLPRCHKKDFLSLEKEEGARKEAED